MWMKAAVVGAAIAAFAMGGRPDKAPDGTGAGTVMLNLNGRAIPLTWVYASRIGETLKVVASNEALATFTDWVTLLDDGYQVYIEYAPKRVNLAYSWGPGRATARATYAPPDPTWAGELTATRWKTTIAVPKGGLGVREITLGIDVDLKHAPPAQ